MKNDLLIFQSKHIFSSEYSKNILQDLYVTYSIEHDLEANTLSNALSEFYNTNVNIPLCCILF